MSTPTPAKDLAQQLMTALGIDFAVPDVDLSDADFQLPDETGNPLYGAVDSLLISDLTSGAVGGGGVFDQIMSANKAHLEDEYRKGRLTGDQFTKAYVELTTASMNSALQFLLGRQQSYWQTLLVQQQARRAEAETITARIGLETAKAQLAAARSQAAILEAQYVLALMQVAGEDAKYLLTHAQLDLIREQVEAARAQTLNTRSDGTTAVEGIMGKQRELYTQQIDSYQKDAAFKVGKLYVDGWLTQKTIDEGLSPPTELTNSVVETVLGKLRSSVALTTP